MQNFPNSKGNIKYVAYLGKYVLGAYLISDHEIIRESLWQWLKPFEYMKTHTLM